jgi:hypothetical protein
MILTYIVIAIVSGAVTLNALGADNIYLALVLAPLVGAIVISLAASVQYYRAPHRRPKVRGPRKT